MEEVLRQINESRDYLQKKIKPPLVGVILGSGLGGLVESLSEKISIPYEDIPHFPSCTVTGHNGRLVAGKLGSKPVVMMQGRFHIYEGNSPATVVLPVRVLARLGVKVLIITNAAGGMAPGMKPTDLMVITDHINLTGTNPLLGPNINEFGERFPSLSDLYSSRLNKKLLRILEKNKICHSSGVYCGVTGPSFETSAEIRFMQTIGASAVGMSTVFEAIAAKHMGLEVCGVSCITNICSSTGSGEGTSHSDVNKNAKKSEENFSSLLKEFIADLG